MSEYEVVVQFETKEDQERYFKNISINIKGILSVSKINLLHIEELEHKLELAKEALESISVKEYHCLCNYTCKEALEKLK